MHACHVWLAICFIICLESCLFFFDYRYDYYNNQQQQMVFTTKSTATSSTSAPPFAMIIGIVFVRSSKTRNYKLIYLSFMLVLLFILVYYAHHRALNYLSQLYRE